jgi:hypothetical protein
VLFSQRKGLKPVRAAIQTDGIDTDLRNALWDVLQLTVWETEPYLFRDLDETSLDWLFKIFWHKYFKKPIDTRPHKTRDAIQAVRDYFFKCEWNEVYDFMEFTANNASDKQSHDLINLSNVVLARELSGYRFVGKTLIEISSEQEIKSIESALQNTSLLSGTHAHLQAALDLLSDRKNPDFRNSIKESISAVESISQLIAGTPGATLGAALKTLEAKAAIHPALKASLSSLYGYTSDSNGIRHAMLEEPHLSFTDAKFMLVACTGFVNYLVGKASEIGIKLS